MDLLHRYLRISQFVRNEKLTNLKKKKTVFEDALAEEIKIDSTSNKKNKYGFTFKCTYASRFSRRVPTSLTTYVFT